ncbi:MAG: 2-dehydropantoate 2-reductase [Candidatus Omnitrophica bacterium]|nr:2-dehydropantoate 2-reductase [Candidatus Omnitrophota bacterium]
MKIAIVGGGAIGSLVAANLVKSGQDVLLVGRPDHVEVIRRNGLLVRSAEGEQVVEINVATKLDQKHDLVIFAVKTQDLEEAYQDNCQYLEDCLVMTIQNGVQADNMLRTHFTSENMISSIVMFGATYVNPGEVIFNFPGDWVVGKPYSANDQKLKDVVEILNKAFSVTVVDNIMGMKWLKLFVNFNNCIPALIGKSMQETFADLDFCKLSVMLLKEGVGFVQKAEVSLVSLPNFPAERILGLASMPTEKGAGIIHDTLTRLSEEPLYGSILQSIKRGKPSEIDFINGEVTYIAQSMRESAPLNRRVVDLVHQVEQEGKFFSIDKIKKEFNL